MKKNLILMTALFAGSMIVNDGFCGRSLKPKPAAPVTQQPNPMQVVESSNDTQQLEENIQALKKDLSLRQATITRCEEEIEDLQITIKKYSNAISGLNNEKKEQKKEIEELNAKIELKQKEIANLQLQVNSFQTSNNETITEQTKEIEELNAKIVEKTKEIEELNAKIVEKTKEIEELNAKIAEKTKEIDNLKKEIEKKNETINKLEEQITNQNKTILNLSTDRDQYSKKYTHTSRILYGVSATLAVTTLAVTSTTTLFWNTITAAVAPVSPTNYNTTMSCDNVCGNPSIRDQIIVNDNGRNMTLTDFENQYQEYEYDGRSIFLRKYSSEYQFCSLESNPYYNKYFSNTTNYDLINENAELKQENQRLNKELADCTNEQINSSAYQDTLTYYVGVLDGKRLGEEEHRRDGMLLNSCRENFDQLNRNVSRISQNKLTEGYNSGYKSGFRNATDTSYKKCKSEDKEEISSLNKNIKALKHDNKQLIIEIGEQNTIITNQNKTIVEQDIMIDRQNKIIDDQKTEISNLHTTIDNQEEKHKDDIELAIAKDRLNNASYKGKLALYYIVAPIARMFGYFDK